MSHTTSRLHADHLRSAISCAMARLCGAFCGFCEPTSSWDTASLSEPGRHWRHDLKHYVPCLTMSRNGEPLQILPGEIRSPPAKPADMTRHSFLLAADSSGRRGVSPQVYSDPVVHAAMMFSKLSPSWQSSLSDEFVGFQLVRDQARRRVEPARESSPGCNPARTGILQTARYAPQGVLRGSRQNSLGVKHTAHDGPVSTGTGLLE